MALTYGVKRNINGGQSTIDRYNSSQGSSSYVSGGSASSTWANKLSSLYDTISNRKFSYNQQEDPLYLQYQQMYERNAKLAQDNAVGQAAALSGGYSNSYAETAGQAMYNQAMNGLNEKALDLANAAQNRYQMETDNLLNQYQMAGQMYSNAYQQERDAISDKRYADEWAYQKERDAVSDSQWQQNYNYQKERDKVSDSQWQQNYNYQKDRDKVSDDRYNTEWNYQKERDLVSDKQNEQSLAYQYAMNGYTKDANGNWKYTGTNADKQFDQELAYKYSTSGYEYNSKTGKWEYTGVGVEPVDNTKYTYKNVTDFLDSKGKDYSHIQTEEYWNKHKKTSKYSSYTEYLKNALEYYG